MPRFVDLHTHSSASDGRDSPAALVARAASLGLAAIALTDHDSVAGLDEAAAAGARHGIEVVRGCELAVSSPCDEVHLLGLWLPERAPNLEAALKRIGAAREARNREMIEGFRRIGYDLSYQELLETAAGATVGRPHLARLLTAKGICASPRDAFNRFIGDDKAMFIPRVLPTPEEGLALLRSEGALTVFAHPMMLKASPNALESLVARLSASGLDALEAYHAEHTPKAARRAEQLARRYNLALSGGSDYHGELHSDRPLGLGAGKRPLPYSLLEGLQGRRRARAFPQP
ncbi:MAG: PHP domain-containing protein [Deltaproteobacteria bacterium]|nr:PHP domain-containing protein [Deltaproteobacteria bacterium]